MKQTYEMNRKEWNKKEENRVNKIRDKGKIKQTYEMTD